MPGDIKTNRQLKFKDKTIIITGSSKGIGKTTAHLFLSMGANVTINGRNKDQLNRTAEEFRQAGYKPLVLVADVTNETACQNLINETVKHFGHLDYLVNNAGIPFRGKFEEIPSDVFQTVVDGNLMSAVYCTRAALPHIKKTKGSIIYISSLSGGVRGLPRSTPYSIGKMGLTALAQCLRVELYDSGVNFGVVRVGFVNVYQGKKVMHHDGQMREVHRKGHQTEMDVAKAVVRVIKRKRFMITQTPLGKVFQVLQWLAPGIITRILLWSRNSKMYD